MAIAKGVSALVLNKKGEVLITQRQDLRTWVFPGGRMDEGETPEAAVKREIEEETGIRIKVKRLVAIYLYDHFLWKGINLFFLAEQSGGSLKRQKGEVLELRWIKKQEIPKFLSKRHQKRFKEAFSNDKRIKLRMRKGLPLPFYKLPLFLWRRSLGKKLGLVRV